MDLKDIKAIIDLMKKNSISEFELEKQEFKIRLKRSTNGGAAHLRGEEMVTQAYMPLPAATSQGGGAALPTSSGSGASSDLEIKSPMVGTFYRSSAPGSKPFVEVGQAVKAGDTICIIEAMKLLNEIEADHDGVVKEILAENGEPVEYGQPLIALA